MRFAIDNAVMCIGIADDCTIQVDAKRMAKDAIGFALVSAVAATLNDSRKRPNHDSSQ